MSNVSRKHEVQPRLGEETTFSEALSSDTKAGFSVLCELMPSYPQPGRILGLRYEKPQLLRCVRGRGERARARAGGGTGLFSLKHLTCALDVGARGRPGFK